MTTLQELIPFHKNAIYHLNEENEIFCIHHKDIKCEDCKPGAKILIIQKSTMPTTSGT